MRKDSRNTKHIHTYYCHWRTPSREKARKHPRPSLIPTIHTSPALPAPPSSAHQTVRHAVGFCSEKALRNRQLRCTRSSRQKNAYQVSNVNNTNEPPRPPSPPRPAGGLASCLAVIYMFTSDVPSAWLAAPPMPSRNAQSTPRSWTQGVGGAGALSGEADGRQSPPAARSS